MRATARFGAGALALAAAVLGLGSLDRPAGPAARLSCPSGLRDIEPDRNNWPENAKSPRQQVADRLADDSTYTRAHMTGRLDDHRLADGTVEVLARGMRHEPIAVYRFGRQGARWALRYSAQCGAPDIFAANVQAPSTRLVCPGDSIGGIIDRGDGGGPADHETPQDKVRRLHEFGEGPTYVEEHAVAPAETRYLYEGTVAFVILRDLYRRPIGIYQLKWYASGWGLVTINECSSGSPAEDARPA